MLEQRAIPPIPSVASTLAELILGGSLASVDLGPDQASDDIGPLA